MRKKIYILFIVLSAIIISGCQGTDQGDGAGDEKSRLDIFTTVYPLQFIAEQIGGDFVQVQTVYPPGSDEHTYEPSQRDMIELADSDLFFYIGLGLEGFAKKAESTLKNQHVTMVAVGEMIPLEAHDRVEGDHEEESHEGDEDQEHHHGDIDPHIWIDPVLMQDMSEKVYEVIVEKMPHQQETFEKNYAILIEELKKVNDQFSELTSNAKRKEFIVAHAAYGYWESRYGIEQISIAGISSTNEPSQKKLASLIDMIKEEQLPYILYEQNINSKLADVVREATGAESLKLHNLAVLTEKDIENKDNYFTLMERNMGVLEKALNE